MKEVMEVNKSSENKVNHFINKNKEKLMLYMIEKFIKNKLGRKILVGRIEKNIKNFISKISQSKIPYMTEIKAQFLVALVKGMKKNIDRGYLSADYAWKILNRMIWGFFIEDKNITEKFHEKYNIYPPGLGVISPTQKCNLNCDGCYANSKNTSRASLEFDIVDKMVNEMCNVMGTKLVVISGGEPFMWRSNGKGILDIIEKYPDIYFLIYTNGTMITDDVIKRLYKLGNATPTISVEGYEKETDKRRGNGMYKKILKLTENLRKQGIAYGVSITATKENTDIFLQDKFYDFWFDEMGVTYMWMFHYMPIGRAKDSIGLMPTPEQRVKLLKEWEHVLFEKEYFVGDFWNSGACSDGCIAYGREGGYFYVDWNGNINPCVFVPYHKDNIIDLYNNGKTLVDGLMSDYFERGRAWQREYGFYSDEPKNIFTPCSIKDNHADFREKILSDDVKPSDEAAKQALEDPEYFKVMCKYGEEIKELTEPIWQEKIKESNNKVK